MAVLQRWELNRQKVPHGGPDALLDARAGGHGVVVVAGPLRLVGRTGEGKGKGSGGGWGGVASRRAPR